MKRRAIANNDSSRITEVALYDNMVIFYDKEPGYNGKHIGVFECDTEDLAVYDFDELVRENNLAEIGI